ncbi:hypothetical protein ACFC18_54620 [Streptomyces sp. NPDC056121]|uniref:hypothetical protein n=1 Tax=Streptomyces sp. NPDC056121 TaxID=3345718 RepID=UPI0035D9F552
MPVLAPSGRDKETLSRLPRSGERTVLDTDATGKRHDTGDRVLYTDDFGYAHESASYLKSRGNQPRYMVDNTGAWDVGKDADAGNVLYQYMDQSMKDTAAWNKSTPNTTVGDFRWENYTASVDVAFAERTAAAPRSACASRRA